MNNMRWLFVDDMYMLQSNLNCITVSTLKIVFFHVSKENSWRTLEFQPNFLAITLNTLLNLGNLT